METASTDDTEEDDDLLSALAGRRQQQTVPVSHTDATDDTTDAEEPAEGAARRDTRHGGLAVGAVPLSHNPPPTSPPASHHLERLPAQDATQPPPRPSPPIDQLPLAPPTPEQCCFNAASPLPQSAYPMSLDEAAAATDSAPWYLSSRASNAAALSSRSGSTMSSTSNAPARRPIGPPPPGPPPAGARPVRLAVNAMAAPPALAPGAMLRPIDPPSAAAAVTRVALTPPLVPRDSERDSSHPCDVSPAAAAASTTFETVDLHPPPMTAVTKDVHNGADTPSPPPSFSPVCSQSLSPALGTPLKGDAEPAWLREASAVLSPGDEEALADAANRDVEERSPAVARKQPKHHEKPSASDEGEAPPPPWLREASEFLEREVAEETDESAPSPTPPASPTSHMRAEASGGMQGDACRCAQAAVDGNSAPSAKALGKMPMTYRGATSSTSRSDSDVFLESTSTSPGVTAAVGAAPMRTTFEAMSASERAALIDQATFFGMDLRSVGAVVLHGGDPSAGSSSTAAACTPTDVRKADPSKACEMPTITDHSLDAPAENEPPTSDPKVRMADTARLDFDDILTRQPPSSSTQLSLSEWSSALYLLMAGLARYTQTLLIAPWGRFIKLAESAADATDVAVARTQDAAAYVIGLMAYHLASMSVSIAKVVGSTALRAANPLFLALHKVATQLLRLLHAMRRYRTGRHLSNSIGAFTSLVMVRTIVLMGPVLGAMIWSPLQMLWVAAGLTDLRIFVVALALLLLALIRFYMYIGWID